MAGNISGPRRILLSGPRGFFCWGALVDGRGARAVKKRRAADEERGRAMILVKLGWPGLSVPLVCSAKCRLKVLPRPEDAGRTLAFCTG